MLSLYVKPLTFDNKKNEILYSNYNIEWKKQVATVALKKGLSPVEFMNDKICIKMEPTSAVVGRFKYIVDNVSDTREIFLVSCPKDKVSTNLYYTSHIPNKEVIILEGNDSKKLSKSNNYLRVNGEVYAFCINIATYYLEEINLDNYIEFVQIETSENGSDIADETDDELESDINKDSNDSESENQFESSDDVDDVDDDDDDDVDDVDDDDVDDDDDTDDEDILEDDEEDILEAEVDADPDAEPDEPEDDEAEDDEAEVEAEEETEAIEEVEDGENADEVEIDDIEDEPLPVSKKKKQTQSKSLKFNSGIDISIIFNVLKQEDKNLITPETELHEKRIMNIKIFKILQLPIKTIQLIEKGIYNYTIDKCSTNAIIPIWENMEFVDIYISKSKSLYSNLNNKCYVKNMDLINKIKTKKIDPYELAFLDTYKLYLEKWIDIIEEKTKVEKMLKESLKESATDLFECHRCHKRKTIYCEVQTRSSDEPMTKFITCLECGCKWKKY